MHRVEDWGRYPAQMDVREFYGGDLQGVLDKMDYLQELGVEVIYLTLCSYPRPTINTIFRTMIILIPIWVRSSVMRESCFRMDSGRTGLPLDISIA